MLKHIAIIPDGNRRWARERKLLPWRGHLEGAKNLERILKKAWELKIPYVTFWGMSADNISKRSKEEVLALFRLFEKYFNRLFNSKEIEKEEVQINVFGKWQKLFPKKLKETIKKVIKKTKKYKKFFLTLLLAYNGTDEMLEAISKIVKKAKNKKIKITEDFLIKNLWTGKLPPVDLIIRTGCEDDPHNSAGFMMWKSAYSQFYFTKTLFPDFPPEEFEKAINDCLKREKRFGA